TGLVLQTVLPPLLMAGDHSSVVVTGGTHNPMAPTAHFLHHCFAPALRRLGASVGFQLLRPGFFPKGGGKLAMHLSPKSLRRLDWTDRGQLVSVRGEILIVGLPFHIAQREMQSIREHLRASGWPLPAVTVREPEDVAGPGNVVSIRAVYENADEVFTSFGEKGKPAEQVAKEAAQAALHWLLSGVPVGPHLADQLLIPMSLAGGGSFVTSALDQHTPTNAAVIEQVMGVKTRFEEREGDRVLVTVGER
ncbi:MAG: RNA 3'-terminal phosphate cyclase, partial [Planctomycetota bacterium]